MKSAVSGEFMYFGRESSRTRPPNAIILERVSKMGNNSLWRKKSMLVPREDLTRRPASARSASCMLLAIASDLSDSQPAGA